jgi:Tfp pilus assembly protein PilX
VVLILLVAVTALSMASLQTALLELLMAGNAEARLGALQKAQGAVEAAASEADNFVLPGAKDHINCTPGFDVAHPGTTCTETTVTFAAAFAASGDAADTHARVQRLHPLLADCAAARGLESECGKLDYAAFSVESRYRSARPRGGSAVVVQGYLLAVPSGTPGAPQ